MLNFPAGKTPKLDVFLIGQLRQSPPLRECFVLFFPSMGNPTVKRCLPWVAAAALFMEQLDSTIVNPAIPAMAASLIGPLLGPTVGGLIVHWLGNLREIP